MKNIQLTTIALCLIFVATCQEIPVGQFGLYARADLPIRSSMPNMSSNFGMGLMGARRLTDTFPIFLELKGSLGRYHSTSATESFFLVPGQTTQINVNYRSNLHHFQIGTKLYFSPFYKKIRGFITPQFGHSFFRTAIRFSEPEPQQIQPDEDLCAPMHNEVKHRSSLWTYGGELGAEINLPSIHDVNQPGNGRFFVSISYLGSFRNAEYVNVKYMQHEPQGAFQNNHHHHTDGQGRPLTGEFINLSTNMTHEHKIAEIYSNPMRLITLNIGFKINL
jgi:hypothetical protein